MHLQQVFCWHLQVPNRVHQVHEEPKPVHSAEFQGNFNKYLIENQIKVYTSKKGPLGMYQIVFFSKKASDHVSYDDLQSTKLSQV